MFKACVRGLGGGGGACRSYNHKAASENLVKGLFWGLGFRVIVGGLPAPVLRETSLRPGRQMGKGNHVTMRRRESLGQNVNRVWDGGFTRARWGRRGGGGGGVVLRGLGFVP